MKRRRIRVHRSVYPGRRWVACKVNAWGQCVGALAWGDSHAEVIEALDALRPTLEPCS